jgi:hypothetical protein
MSDFFEVKIIGLIVLYSTLILLFFIKKLIKAENFNTASYNTMRPFYSGVVTLLAGLLSGFSLSILFSILLFSGIWMFLQ